MLFPECPSLIFFTLFLMHKSRMKIRFNAKRELRIIISNSTRTARAMRYTHAQFVQKVNFQQMRMHWLDSAQAFLGKLNSNIPKDLLSRLGSHHIQKLQKPVFSKIKGRLSSANDSISWLLTRLQRFSIENTMILNCCNNI